MMSSQSKPFTGLPNKEELRHIITDPNGVQKLVEWADHLGEELEKQKLSSSQIRALFGEVRQIQAQWGINRQRAFRRLVLLKPKMRYRAGKERGKAKEAVATLVNVLIPALELVIEAPPRPAKAPSGSPNNQDDNFQRFTEFFEAILAYHKAYGGQ